MRQDIGAWGSFLHPPKDPKSSKIVGYFQKLKLMKLTKLMNLVNWLYWCLSYQNTLCDRQICLRDEGNKCESGLNKNT